MQRPFVPQSLRQIHALQSFCCCSFFSHAGGEEEVRETNGQIHPESRAPFESVDQETGRCPSGGKHVDVDC